MMDTMMDYSIAMMGAVSEFLMSEPIIYILGLVLFLFIVKGFKVLCGKEVNR